MLVLAIDTTSEHGGVALFRDDECLATVRDLGSSGYSVTLFQAVDRALAQAGAQLSKLALTLHDIELFAAANGPGSFTGIRTGLAATQGWATALRRPVVGVSILQAMVHQARPTTPWAAAIMDARRGEFYVGLFRRGANGISAADQVEDAGLVVKPKLLQDLLEERLNSTVPLGAVACIVREHDLAAQALRSNLSNRFEWQTVSDCLLESIARLAAEACRGGKAQSPAELDACYIRRSDAELNWHA
ncbi:MAG: tRNA (adenosine(37)-N6)-threonylcarbamoyltransferase complex dimerization subunit type 1 TsaB [Terriglobia bacterium]|jgi:tRNA threonylcarbamoyladenosine biosynthesis protein TsaB